METRFLLVSEYNIGECSWSSKHEKTSHVLCYLLLFVDLPIPEDVETTEPRVTLIAALILVMLLCIAVVLLIIQQLKYRRLRRQLG